MSLYNNNGTKDNLTTSVEAGEFFVDRNYQVRNPDSGVGEYFRVSPIEGQVCYEIFFELSAPCPSCPVTEVFRTGKASRSSCYDAKRQKFLSLAAVPSFDAKTGKIIGAIETFRDVSVLFTDAELARSHERAMLMLDSLPIACGLFNNRLEMIDCNPATVHFFQCKGKAEVCERIFEMFPERQPDGRLSSEAAVTELSKTFETGVNIVEWLFLLPDGVLVPTEVTIVKLFCGGEEMLATYTRDLRAFKAQEEKRRIAEERTETMLNAMPLCCNFWDKDFNNIACNDEAVRLFELDSQQEYLEHFFDLSPERQPSGRLSSEAALEKITQAFKEGHARFEWLHQKRDGTPIPAEITLNRLLFKDEPFVVGYTRDLREQKAMLAEIDATHQELAKSRDEALALSSAKSEFLANMSHEIRTPMNGIIGLSYLALQFPDIEPQLRDYIIKIDDSAKALLRIINDILDFSKINAGKLDIEHLPFDLMVMLEHTIQPLIPAITDKGLEIIFDFAKDTPTYLVGDAVRLRQVILNLVNNAVKFTQHGSITICIEVETQDVDGATLRFAVSDTGVGIASEYLGDLFDPFTQADTSVTRRYGGTGLGLAICKQIITLMGGKISVSSSLGKGSIFTFTAKFGITNAPKDVQTHVCDLTQKRVLVVDDNEISRRILSKYLQNFGAIVDVAADGQQALTIFSERTSQGASYYAVVVDWKMPGMGGLEVVSGIRSISSEDTPLIVMVTAYQREIIDFDVQGAGIDAILTKPITPSSLLDSLLRVAEVREQPHWDNRTLSSDVDKSCIWVTKEYSSPLVGKHVLLAEDNQINQLIAKELLANYGISVAVAATGREAINLAVSGNFDAILMDIQMPEMDGIEATKFIRENYSALDDTPIIAMTAHAMTGDHEKSIMAGMQAHITKPIDPEDLHATLVQWLLP